MRIRLFDWKIVLGGTIQIGFSNISTNLFNFANMAIFYFVLIFFVLIFSIFQKCPSLKSALFSLHRPLPSFICSLFIVFPFHGFLCPSISTVLVFSYSLHLFSSSFSSSSPPSLLVQVCISSHILF